MRVAVVVVIALFLLSGCGGSGGARNTAARTDSALPRVENDAGVAAGREACKQLPAGTLPEKAGKSEKIAALRAYLQQTHPNDDIPALLRGCRAELHL